MFKKEEATLPIITTLRALKIIPNVFNMLWEIDNKVLISVVTTTVLQGFIPAVIAYITARIVDYIVSGHGWSQHLAVLISIELGLVLTAGILKYVSQIADESIRDKTWHYLSLKTFGHAAALDLEFFEDPENFDKLTKAQQELGYRPMMIIINLLHIIRNIATVFGFILVVLTFQPILVYALLIALIPSLIAAKESGNIAFISHDITTREGRRADYFDFLLSADFFAKEIRLFGLARRFLEERRNYGLKIISIRLDAIKRATLGFMRADILSILVHYACLIYVVFQAARGRVSVGDFVLLATALERVRIDLSMALGNFSELLEHSLFFKNLTDFLSVKPQITPPQKPAKIPNRVNIGISFENVTFTYHGASKPVFKSLNLKLNAGETTALVGINGSGKTTLVKLLTRLYDPDSGIIKFEGENIQNYNVDDYRRCFSTILQDFAKYQLTAKENVTLACPNEKEYPERIKFLEQSKAILGLINELHHGWDTYLGRQFDPNGQNLSGGQWQVIALARAIYRDTLVLVLDEPSAALDAEAEVALFKEFKRISDGKLCLLVSHRFNTVKMADRIIVIEGGEIIEDSSHDNLLAAKGRYFEMFTTQLESYTSTKQ
jgi:ATP-binding cassette subfamily B protein